MNNEQQMCLNRIVFDYKITSKLWLDNKLSDKDASQAIGKLLDRLLDLDDQQPCAETEQAIQMFGKTFDQLCFGK